VDDKGREIPEVAIRLARQEDAPDIITMIIEQHGNYYPYMDIYSMDFVRRAIEKQDLYIVVAECAGGLVAGMTGANSKTQFAGTLEWIMLTIRPSCRGFGLGRRLLAFLQQALPAERCAAVYGHCMTLDTASQKILAGMGHRITGALLNSYRVDTHAENFAGLLLPVKHNLIVTCMPGRKKDAGPLHVPPAHAGYVRGVYESLGVAYELRPGEGAEPEPASSVCSVTHMEEHRYCEVMAERIGRDFGKILDDALDHYGALEDQGFNALVNLNDPAAPWAYRLLEDRGFSFAGIHALSGDHEYMLSHYSPVLPVAFDRIAVLPGFAGEFAYIREQYEKRRH
jgi:GNAT superfamily N-acetyltransferase